MAVALISTLDSYIIDITNNVDRALELIGTLNLTLDEVKNDPCREKRKGMRTC